ncbi:MAG: hypothetical protein WAW52_12605 [Methanothrix sp.]
MTSEEASLQRLASSQTSQKVDRDLSRIDANQHKPSDPVLARLAASQVTGKTNVALQRLADNQR